MSRNSLGRACACVVRSQRVCTEIGTIFLISTTATYWHFVSLITIIPQPTTTTSTTYYKALLLLQQPTIKNYLRIRATLKCYYSNRKAYTESEYISRSCNHIPTGPLDLSRIHTEYSDTHIRFNDLVYSICLRLLFTSTASTTTTTSQTQRR